MLMDLEPVAVSRLPAEVAMLAEGLLALSLLGEPAWRREQAFEKLHHGEMVFPHPVVIPRALGDQGWRFYNSPHLHLDHLEAIVGCLAAEAGDPEGESLFHAIDRAWAVGATACQTLHVSCRWHSNGNLHLRLRNPAYVGRLNELLAERFPHQRDARANAA